MTLPQEQRQEAPVSGGAPVLKQLDRLVNAVQYAYCSDECSPTDYANARMDLETFVLGLATGKAA